MELNIQRRWLRYGVTFLLVYFFLLPATILGLGIASFAGSFLPFVGPVLLTMNWQIFFLAVLALLLGGLVFLTGAAVGWFVEVVVKPQNILLSSQRNVPEWISAVALILVPLILILGIALYLNI